MHAQRKAANPGRDGKGSTTHAPEADETTAKRLDADPVDPDSNALDTIITSYDPVDPAACPVSGAQDGPDPSGPTSRTATGGARGNRVLAVL